MSTLRPGEVEVIVIAECAINGPDHISLGLLYPGDRVVTHEIYLAHLLEHNLVCMPDELDKIDIAVAQGDLADLDAELARMLKEQEEGGEEETNEGKSEAEEESEPELPAETEARVAALEPEAQAKTRENIARVNKAAANRSKAK